MSTGTYDPSNQSYDGALGLMAASRADAYLMPLGFDVIPERFVEPSKPLAAVNYVSVQSIKEEKRSSGGFSSLLDLVVPPLEFLTATLSGVLMHLVCLCLFSLVLRKLFKRSKGTHLQIQILAFFFLLFWFFIDQFYNGISIIFH